MKKRGSTVKDIEDRRRELGKIITDYQQNGKTITREALLRELAKKGYHIDMSTLYRDRGVLNKGNTFVEDLSYIGNYSAYVQGIFEKIDWIEENAMELARKKWTSNKIIMRKTKNGESTEHHYTSELPSPKTGLLKILLKCQETKLNMFKGDNINVSVALLGKKLESLREEIDLLKRENRRLQAENVAVKAKQELN